MYIQIAIVQRSNYKGLRNKTDIMYLTKTFVVETCAIAIDCATEMLDITTDIYSLNHEPLPIHTHYILYIYLRIS